MAKKNSSTVEEKGLSEQLKAILDETNSIHGGDALMTLEGTSGLWPIEKRMPTGSLQLDMAIGIGGWPRGRFNQIVGEESSGKTTLALMTVASAQRRGETVVYIDAEMALNPDWMVKLGVDIESLLISQPGSLESAVDIAMTILGTGKCDLLVIDSVAALKSRIVMEGEADQETRALEARRWSTQTPKLVQAAATANTALLFINQVRDSMDMYGPKESIPGGRTLKFAMSTTVKLKKSLEGRGQEEGIDYHDAKFEIIKNKQGSPYKKGEFTLYTKRDNPIDYEADVYYAALRHEAIVEDQRFVEEDEEFISKKGWFTLLINNDAVLEAIKAHEGDDFDQPGMSKYRTGKMLEWFKEVPGLAAAVETQLLESLNRDAIISVDSESDSEIDHDVEASEEDDD